MDSFRAITVATIFIIACSSADVEEFVARYDNYRVYRAVPANEKQLKILSDMESTSDSYIFLFPPKFIEKPVEVIVPPHKYANFHEVTTREGIETCLIESNLQSRLDDEAHVAVSRSNVMSWKVYHRIETINQYLDDILNDYPDILSPIVVGKTFENREIRGVKLSKRKGNKGVFVEAGIHAREWISPATATFILNQLLTSDDPAVKRVSETYDWYFIPVLNVDGYVYTHTTERFWRKSRKPYGSYCYGADINRNFDHHWGEQGSSNYACSDSYRGGKPFSEIEAKSLSTYYQSLNDSISIYISFHSFSQMILLPYGYTSKVPSHYKDLLKIGERAAQDLAKRYGTKYTVGDIYSTIYPVSGSTIDWVIDNSKTKVAACFELRPGPGNAMTGFALSPDQIIPTGEETLDGIIGMLTQSEELGY